MPTGADRPPPPPSTAVEAGTSLTRPEGRSYPTARGRVPSSLLPWDAAPREVGWRRRPAAALPGSATLLLWQPFPSEPAAAFAPLLGLLAPSLSPSLPASLRCGLGEGWPRRGSGGGDPSQGAEPPAGRGSAPGTILCPRSKPDRPAAAVLTGPGILLELVLPGSGRAARARR